MFPAERASGRGLPPVELRFRAPSGLSVVEPQARPDGGGALFHCEEIGPTGRLLGTLELHLVSVAVVIDRAGVLSDLARAAAADELSGSARWQLLVEGQVEFGGGSSGHRIDVVIQFDKEGRLRPDSPYASWLALAGPDPILPVGLLAVIRAAAPEWRAAASLLDSLEIAGPSGSRSGGHAMGGGPRLDLPLVRTR